MVSDITIYIVYHILWQLTIHMVYDNWPLHGTAVEKGLSALFCPRWSLQTESCHKHRDTIVYTLINTVYPPTGY